MRVSSLDAESGESVRLLVVDDVGLPAEIRRAAAGSGDECWIISVPVSPGEIRTEREHRAEITYCEGLQKEGISRRRYCTVIGLPPLTEIALN